MSQQFDLDKNLRQHLKNYLQNKSYRDAQPLITSLDQPGVTVDAIQAIARSLSSEYHVRLLNTLQANINQLQQQATGAQQAPQQQDDQSVEDVEVEVAEEANDEEEISE